jgi:hypothetical protein
MKQHATTLTMATRSILRRLSWRIRTRCEPLSNYVSFSLHYCFPRSTTVVLRIFCNDNVNIRVHRRARPRLRVHLVCERPRVRLSCAGPDTHTNATIIAIVTGASPLAPMAPSPRTDFAHNVRGVTAAALVKGCKYVREARSIRFAG